MLKHCTGCGKPFETTDARKQRCRKNCGRTSADKHAARSRKRQGHEVTFVGVDGEGVGRPDGTHEYILLSVGSKSLYKEDGSALNYSEIFPFLYNCFRENKMAVYVGYFLSYDFTMWLKGLPEERARMLLTEQGIAKRKPKSKTRSPAPFPVRYDGWEFDMLAGKRFKLRPEKSKEPWLYVCDVGSFFQMSFLSAIDPSDWPTPLLSPEEYAIIREGKAERNQTADYGTPVDPKMIEYNIHENEVLARLMTVTNKGLVDSGVKLSRQQWFGPGQAAQKWLKDIGAPKGDDIRDMIPEAVNEAAQASYYGGWFEIMASGHIPGPSYEYDINSAYPYIIGQLPCLRHGRWIHRSPHQDEFGLIYCTVETRADKRIGPMPHRTRNGAVLRPRKTRGWYWRHELDASIRAIDTIVSDIDDGWVYDRCDCESPFQPIVDLYQRRLQVGKKSPQGKGLKLVYNSAYGKQAQSIGNPMFGNAIYASLITAGCRTMILDAIATHPDRDKAVLMVATDGVYFISEHPSLDIDKERLGGWDSEVKYNLCLFKPGVYWDDRSRERISQGANTLGVKSRGVNQKALASQITRIDEEFTKAGWPTVELVIPFSIVSLKLALHRNKWHTAGKITHNDVVTQSSRPDTKRQPFYDRRRKIRWTDPYPIHENLETVPYDKSFGLALAEAILETDATTPEGSYAMLVEEAFRGM